jgi:hypothetical protein
VPRSIRNALGAEFAAQAEAALARRAEARQRAVEAAHAAERSRIAALDEAAAARRELERSREQLRQEREVHRAERHVAGSGLEALEHELRVAVSAARHLQRQRDREHKWYKLIAATLVAVFAVGMMLVGIARSHRDTEIPGTYFMPLLSLSGRMRGTALPIAPAGISNRQIHSGTMTSFERLSTLLEPYPSSDALVILANANALLGSEGQPQCSVIAADGTPSVLIAAPAGGQGPVAEALDRCVAAVERILARPPPPP